MQKTKKLIRFKNIIFFALSMVTGCSQKILIESTPPGASVYQGAKKIGETPMSHSIQWYPRKQIPLRIQLPGYRPLSINAGQDLGYLSVGADLIQLRYNALLGKEHRSACHALLIKEHGRVGTWTPKEAKKQR